MTWDLLKLAHILSATVLFGTGIGTAFQMWATHRRGDVGAIAVTARSVVLADWLFTTPAVILQPLTGIGLIVEGGHDWRAPWLLAAWGLYLVAAACWLPVVGLQLRLARLAEAAAATGAALPPAYFDAMRWWFRLGWPAFLGLVLVFWLMVAKPPLWPAG